VTAAQLVEQALVKTEFHGMRYSSVSATGPSKNGKCYAEDTAHEKSKADRGTPNGSVFVEVCQLSWLSHLSTHEKSGRGSFFPKGERSDRITCRS